MLNVQNVGSIDPVGVAAMAPPDWFQDVASKASEEALKGALSKCKGANIAFKPIARENKREDHLKCRGARSKTDRILMGTRGLGGVQGLLLVLSPPR